MRVLLPSHSLLQQMQLPAMQPLQPPAFPCQLHAVTQSQQLQGQKALLRALTVIHPHLLVQTERIPLIQLLGQHNS